MQKLEEAVEVSSAGSAAESHFPAGPAAAPPPAAPWRGIAPHRLKRVLARIDAGLTQPLQVRELANEANMSLFHFARMFKLATGHSPHRYITLQRMERAKALLSGSDMPILGVARSVGYQTQAHFTGVFARNVGTTPKVYRVRHRSSSGDGASKPDGQG